eukprot:7384813-Prymnesium_polylepis.1
MPQAVRSSIAILQWLKRDASGWLPRAVHVPMATTKLMMKARKRMVKARKKRPLGLPAAGGAPEMPPVRFPVSGRA